MSGEKKEFHWVEGLAFCLAWIAIQFCSELLNQFGAYFYSPPADSGRMVYVPIQLVGVMFFLGAVSEGVSNPLVGLFSDRTHTQRRRIFLAPSGRRRPYIFWGSICMVFTLIAVWYPPVHALSHANFYFGVFMLCLHWLFFSIVSIPVLALGPEVATTTESRVKLGVWVAVGSVLGLGIANGLSGDFVKMLSPPGSLKAVPEAYGKLAIIYAVLAFLCFQFLVWKVKERFHGEPSKRGPGALKREMRDVARNRPFVIYFAAFCCFMTGLLASQRSIPYWLEVGLGRNEESVKFVLIPFVLTCLITYAFVPALTRRIGIKWTVFVSMAIITMSLPWMYPIAVSAADSSTKLLYGALLFAVAGVGQGISFVMLTPLVGEIVDYDSRYSGERREALYNGLTHLSWKVAQAMSVLLATQSMYWWGNDAASPLGIFLIGPLSGLCGLVGCVVILAYPKLPPAAEQENA